MKPLDISVVIPVFNNYDSLEELVTRVSSSITSLNLKYEIIFVNDGSADYSWNLISELTKKKKEIKAINLSRNFGQHPAIFAGINYHNAEWIIIMDADLQDKPEEIINLYEKAISGYDMVIAIRNNRKDNFFKKFTSKVFFKFFSFLSNNKITGDIANFGIYNKKVIESILKLNDYHKNFSIFSLWVGFKRTEIPVQHLKRKKGNSQTSFSKMIDLAVNSIFFHSDKLIYILCILGLFIFLFSFLFLGFLIFKYFFLSTPIIGWTSTVGSIFFMGGIILFFIGIIGIYISKVFDQVKSRPTYIIKEKIL